MKNDTVGRLKMGYLPLAFVFLFFATELSSQVNIADPFVLRVDGKFYLYGTDDKKPNDGIPVLVSDDMVNWSGPAGNAAGKLALAKGSSYGTRGFWAPFVVQNNHMFYMYYTANEKIAVATSDSPLGPFMQQEFRPLNDSLKEIDPHVFIDDDGRKYIYFVRLINGNRTFAAELADDMRSLKPGTVVECINQSQPWEIISGNKWPVTEAPAILKHQGKYYLFYTANDFRSPAYNVGYAVSASPLGPFVKYKENPLIRQTDKIKGTGGCEFVTGPGEKLYMFYHAHADEQSPTPRRTLFSNAIFVPGKAAGESIFQVSENKVFLKSSAR
ncbi:MAG: beta-xylosidase [Chitinophagaceae bacterium]|nr:MAG: beta-xylosidase [Chitinophagaceae bacterium]